MSIDLGFAPCTIGDTQVGIVDVPGHENFVKTMVAGASGHGRRDPGRGRRRRRHAADPRAPGHPHAAGHPPRPGGPDEDRPRRRRAIGSWSAPSSASSSAAPSSKRRRSCRSRTSPARVSTPFLEALWNLVAADPAEADRRRVPHAGGAGLLGQGLRHRRGRHPGVRLGRVGDEVGAAAARPVGPHQADRGLRPRQRRGHGRPVRGDQRGPLGCPRDRPRRHALASRAISPRRVGSPARCVCCPARS